MHVNKNTQRACEHDRHSGVERVAPPVHHCRAVVEAGRAATVTTCGTEAEVSGGVWSVTSPTPPTQQHHALSPVQREALGTC